jgi:Zinc finger, C2H2 type
MTDHYAVVNAEDLQPGPGTNVAGPVTCEICQRAFATPAALGVHFRSHGSNKKPCPECGLEFFPGPGMSRHRQAHHGVAKVDGQAPKKGGGGVKPPKAKKLCPECGKAISAKDLLRHRRQVHGYTPGKITASGFVPEPADDITEDDVFNAVVGLLFPRGVIPITALTPLLRWRHATGILLEEVNRG